MSLDIDIKKEWKRFDKAKKITKRAIDLVGWYGTGFAAGAASFGCIGLYCSNFYFKYVKSDYLEYNFQAQELLESYYNGAGFMAGAIAGGAALVYLFYLERRKHSG